MTDTNRKIILDIGANIQDFSTKMSTLQKELSKIRLPADINKSFVNTFSELESALKRLEKSSGKTIINKSDLTTAKKGYEEINRLVGKLNTNFLKLDKLDQSKLIPKEQVTLLKQASTELQNYAKNQQQIETNYKKQADYLAQIKELNATNQSLGRTKGSLTRKMNSLDQNSTEYKNLGKERSQVDKTIEKNRLSVEALKQKIAELKQGELELDQTQGTVFERFKALLQQLGVTNIDSIEQGVNNLRNSLEQANNIQLDKARTQINNLRKSEEELKNTNTNLAEKIELTGDSFSSFITKTQQLDMLKSRLSYFFGLQGGIQIVRRVLQQAIQTVKELDAVMTETAVVTDFSVGDMWKTLPQYTKTANQLGATISGVYDTLRLYVQQGLEANQAMELGISTMKVARIAGLDYATATDYMTSALRGFNMELNQTSAERIADVYSKLAAISASDVEELSISMSKVASLANSVGMSFETTAAYLARGIEATREPAEAIGTALKISA